MIKVNKISGVLTSLLLGGCFLASGASAAEQPKKHPGVAVVACSACQVPFDAVQSKKDQIKTLQKARADKENADIQALKASDPVKFKQAEAARKAEREAKKAEAKKKLTKEERKARDEALKASDPLLYNLRMELKELQKNYNDCAKTCPAK